jgi:predicted transcriptional regulator
MKKKLLDVIFASDKRKSVLMLLKDGPQEMEHLLKFLDTDRQSLLPQIRVLEDHHLVDYSKGICELTTVGKLIVDEMSCLVNTVEVFDVDIEYWGTHNLDFIPIHLLKRINELGKCNIINPPVTELYEMNNNFYEVSKKSKSLCGVTTFFYPHFPEIFSELVSNNVNVRFIISKYLLDKLRKENYANFKNLANNKLFSFFIYSKEMDFMSFSYNDYYTKLRLKKSDGDFNNKYILCSNPDALKWGKELFHHYLKDSEPLKEI